MDKMNKSRVKKVKVVKPGSMDFNDIVDTFNRIGVKIESSSAKEMKNKSHSIIGRKNNNKLQSV